MSDTAKRPRRVSAPIEQYRCPFMTVTHRRAEFDAVAKDYYIVGFKRRGGVVALREGSVLLVRQYRLLIDAPSWELPGGTIEDGENLHAGLARECLEETGVMPHDLEPLVEYYPGLDNVDNRTTIFVSMNTETVRPFEPDPAEVDAIQWIPLEHCLEMVFRREILDAMTIVGLLAFAHWRGIGR